MDGSSHRTFADDSRGGGPGGSIAPGTADLPVGPTQPGVLNTYARADHQHPTLEVANLVGLAALNCATMNNGTFAYVATLKCEFELVVTALAADAISIIAATGKAASKWCRRLTRNLAFEREAAWFIDPINGTDESAGTTAGLAIKTITELSRRLWNGELLQNTTVTVVDDVPAADVGTWNTYVKPGLLLTFTGILGATTGFGGRAINNTVYTGTVTGFVAATIAPGANDIQLTDTTVPVSFTASGVLAAGIIMRRETGAGVADRWWYAAKDLGAKTLRISCPLNSTISLSMNAALAVNDTYKAYALKTLPMQNFGPANSGGSGGNGTNRYLFLRDNKAQNPAVAATGYNVRRDRSWINPLGFEVLGVDCNNVAFDVTGSMTFLTLSTAPPQLKGGMFRGTGADLVSIFGIMGIGGPLVSQGAAIKLFDNAYCTQEQTLAVHDVSAVAIQVAGGARWIAESLTVPTMGISGKGNTGKLLAVTFNGFFSYGAGSTAPPFVAGSTTDANPITIGPTNYTVAALPAVANTVLASDKPFPYGPTAVANGAVVVALGAFGPAGSAATPVRWLSIPDGAGGFFTVPSFT